MTHLIIREIKSEEYQMLGQLMIEIYSKLDGFPKPDEQPKYYEKLANIGSFNLQQKTQVLVALSAENELLGGVVYFSDMVMYGSGGAATKVKNASGIRLLGVSNLARGKGVGKALTQYCIKLANEKNHSQIILHTTQAMQVAWGMYQKLGFERFEDLDFLQQDFPVFGFRLKL